MHGQADEGYKRTEAGERSRASANIVGDGTKRTMHACCRRDENVKWSARCVLFELL